MYVPKCQSSQGRDMAWVVDRRHLTVEDLDICRASPREICGGQGATGTLDFLCQYMLTISPYSSLSGLRLKSKANPFTGLDRPLRLLKFKAPRLYRQPVSEGGKVVSPTHRPPLSPKRYSWYSFLLESWAIPKPQCGRKV
jgi:hypothetical protein